MVVDMVCTKEILRCSQNDNNLVMPVALEVSINRLSMRLTAILPLPIVTAKWTEECSLCLFAGNFVPIIMKGIL